ncbi:hypothetical protein [Streptomyces sp. SID13726]|uniref:hypothetical protein n=1 Tax=Streptomyces sp. SID13726 TaxID=2706058 RepID=UPI0013B95549|nr:hypothetical protein [Streptomyces sp. SID13726]NEB00340.1 hypothetical protein [Streptomyces sp. SID13726]
MPNMFCGSAEATAAVRARDERITLFLTAELVSWGVDAIIGNDVEGLVTSCG